MPGPEGQNQDVQKNKTEQTEKADLAALDLQNRKDTVKSKHPESPAALSETKEMKADRMVTESLKTAWKNLGEELKKSKNATDAYARGRALKLAQIQLDKLVASKDFPGAQYANTNILVEADAEIKTQNPDLHLDFALSIEKKDNKLIATVQDLDLDSRK